MSGYKFISGDHSFSVRSAWSCNHRVIKLPLVRSLALKDLWYLLSTGLIWLEPPPCTSQPGLRPRSGPIYVAQTIILWFPLNLQHLSECSWHSLRDSLFCLHGLGLAEIVPEESITVLELSEKLIDYFLSSLSQFLFQKCFPHWWEQDKTSVLNIQKSWLLFKLLQSWWEEI